MSVYKKLSDAREKFHSLPLKKSGENKFAGYRYFELGDFLVPALEVFKEFGLIGVVRFTQDVASLTITDIETGSDIVITSPMGSAALKGCHEVQNIGAVETYQRRYLWVAALEIVENDALDSVTGSDQKATKPPPPANTATEVMGDAFRALEPDEQTLASDWAQQAEKLAQHSISDAYQDITDNLATIEDHETRENWKCAVSYKLSSKTRNALKAYGQSLRKAA